MKSYDVPNRVAPIRLLSDASINTMIADFSKEKWRKNERDAAFARESVKGLQAELVRRRAHG